MTLTPRPTPPPASAPRREMGVTSYDLVINGAAAADAVVHTDFGDTHSLVPGALRRRRGAGGKRGREFALSRALEPIRDQYDLIFIDCPPSLELLTLNALCAADGIFVPVQCEYYALEGLSDLMATLRAVKRKLNPTLRLFGVLLTMYDGRTQLLRPGGRGGAPPLPRAGLRHRHSPQRPALRGAQPRPAGAQPMISIAAAPPLMRHWPPRSSRRRYSDGIQSVPRPGARAGRPPGRRARRAGEPACRCRRSSPTPSSPGSSSRRTSSRRLADSISQHGLIQPITVRKGEKGFYQIIAGERRWRAARMAGLRAVPVVVIEADDRKAMELALIENLQRRT